MINLNEVLRVDFQFMYYIELFEHIKHLASHTLQTNKAIDSLG